MSSDLKHDIELFKKGVLGDIRNPILKCPNCKKKVKFNVFDLNCSEGYGYLDGNYARVYRCPKCNVLIVKKEEELSQVNAKEKVE